MYQDGNRVASGDHAFNRGLLVLQPPVVFPCGGDHFAPTIPRAIDGRKAADVQFDIIRDEFTKRVEIAADDGGVGGEKNGFGIGSSALSKTDPPILSKSDPGILN